MNAVKIASVAEIRAAFPALGREHAGRAVAYFDGAGGTQVPTPVVEAISDYLLNHNANAHWAYPTSRETDEITADSRRALADFLNAAPDEIVFGQNMTSLTFHLARALGRDFAAGDEVIVTELDHHANVDTWRSLERERGIRLRVAPMDTASGTLDAAEIERLFGAKTRLVAIGAASNALGTVTDVAAVCRMARERGALSFVDAVHFAAHELVDVQSFGCDFLACSAYKFYGPHIGILYGRRELLGAIDFPKLRPAPDAAPERAETGTQSFEAIAGAAAAVDFLASLAAGASRREKLARAFAGIHERKRHLFAILWDGLTGTSGVTVYGPGPEARRTPTVAFTVGDLPARAVSEKLAERGIFASSGNFYALTVVEKLGLAERGLVRAGCACYTTREEVERLVEAVTEIAAKA